VAREDYYRAKARLFTPALAQRAAINIDDPAGRRLAGEATVPVVTFGTAQDANLRATDVTVSREGIRFRAGGLEVMSRLRAAFNVSNCLGVLAVARQLELDDAATVAGI